MAVICAKTSLQTAPGLLHAVSSQLRCREVHRNSDDPTEAPGVASPCPSSGRRRRVVSSRRAALRRCAPMVYICTTRHARSHRDRYMLHVHDDGGMRGEDRSSRDADRARIACIARQRLATTSYLITRTSRADDMARARWRHHSGTWSYPFAPPTPTTQYELLAPETHQFRVTYLSPNCTTAPVST